jgi:hypothetical protein
VTNLPLFIPRTAEPHILDLFNYFAIIALQQARIDLHYASFYVPLSYSNVIFDKDGVGFFTSCMHSVTSLGKMFSGESQRKVWMVLRTDVLLGSLLKYVTGLQ